VDEGLHDAMRSGQHREHIAWRQWPAASADKKGRARSSRVKN
jgi:hypothetical protein